MKRSGAEAWPRKLALDTSAYSHLRRGDERVIDAVASADRVFVPVTVLGELEAAFLGGRRRADNAARLHGFLRDPQTEVVPTTEDVASRYGRIFFALRSAGTPIPVNDIWIAAAVLSTGAHLLTFDRDFEAVPELAVTVLAPLVG